MHRENKIDIYYTRPTIKLICHVHTSSSKPNCQPVSQLFCLLGHVLDANLLQDRFQIFVRLVDIEIIGLVLFSSWQWQWQCATHKELLSKILSTISYDIYRLRNWNKWKTLEHTL